MCVVYGLQHVGHQLPWQTASFQEENILYAVTFTPGAEMV